MNNIQDKIKEITEDIWVGVKSITLPVSLMLITLYSIEYIAGESIAKAVFIGGIIVYCLAMMGAIKRPL